MHKLYYWKVWLKYIYQFDIALSVLSKGLGSAVRRAFGGAPARRASSFTSVEQFTRRQSGSVDVWWLYDDGGEFNASN